MKVQVRYRKNLKMTPGKLAAQVAHVVVGLGVTDPLCTIVVLCVSDSTFNRLRCQVEGNYVHVDSGFTEVEPGTATCLAWVEND
jgi:peptidyl-tRNA hydrolase